MNSITRRSLVSIFDGRTVPMTTSNFLTTVECCTQQEVTMTDSNRPPLTFAFFPDVATFEVASDDITDGEMLANAQVANIMGYGGENLSPQLSWRGFPAETKS